MSNSSGSTLYVGFASDLIRRVYEHRNKLTEGFTKKYNVVELVYYEADDDHDSVLAREKQIKNWRRDKKIKLIEIMNPEWNDLYDVIIS